MIKKLLVTMLLSLAWLLSHVTLNQGTRLTSYTELVKIKIALTGIHASDRSKILDKCTTRLGELEQLSLAHVLVLTKMSPRSCLVFNQSASYTKALLAGRITTIVARHGIDT